MNTVKVLGLYDPTMDRWYTGTKYRRATWSKQPKTYSSRRILRASMRQAKQDMRPWFQIIQLVPASSEYITSEDVGRELLNG